MAATTLAEELPFAGVVYDGHLDRTCSNCYKQLIPDLPKETCYTCGVLNYCSEECKEQDLKFHRQECKYIMRSKYFPSTTTRLVSRIAVRIRRGDVPVAFNGRTFDDLLDHINDYKESSGTVEDPHNRYAEMAYVYQELTHFMGPVHVPPRGLAYSYMGKVFTNQFIVGLYQNAICIMIGLSGHNHSCRPNSFTVCDGQKGMLRTFDPNLAYSRELTFAYIPEWLPRSLRHKSLKFFDCNCERCRDEELNLFESSGKSFCCPEDGVILPTKATGPLVCSNCGKESTLTYEKITWANNLIEKKYLDEEKDSQMGISPKAVEADLKLFVLLQNVLSPYNLYLLVFADYLAEKCEFLGDMKMNRRLIGFSNNIMKEVCPESYLYMNSWFIAARKEAFIAAVGEKSQLGPWDETVDIFKTAYFFSRNLYGPEQEILNLLQILFVQYVSEYTKDPESHVSNYQLHKELLSLTYSEKTVSKGVYDRLRRNAKRREESLHQTGNSEKSDCELPSSCCLDKLDEKQKSDDDGSPSATDLDKFDQEEEGKSQEDSKLDPVMSPMRRLRCASEERDESYC